MQSNEKVSQMPERLQQLLKVKPKDSQKETKRIKSDTYFTTNRGRGMDTKESDRKAIIDIIYREQQNEEWVKCITIERAAVIRGISKPTFYRRLGEMIKEGVLSRKVVSRKDTRYHVNLSKLPKEYARVTLFKTIIMTEINKHIEETVKKFDELEVMKDLSRWIGALAAYTVLKEIETGQPYTDAVDYYIKQPGGAPKFLRRIINIKGNPSAYEDDSKRPKLMTDEPLGNHEEYRQEIEEFYKAIEKLYPQEWMAIEHWFVGKKGID